MPDIGRPPNLHGREVCPRARTASNQRFSKHSDYKCQNRQLISLLVPSFPFPDSYSFFLFLCPLNCGTVNKGIWVPNMIGVESPSRTGRAWKWREVRGKLEYLGYIWASLSWFHPIINLFIFIIQEKPNFLYEYCGAVFDPRKDAGRLDETIITVLSRGANPLLFLW